MNILCLIIYRGSNGKIGIDNVAAECCYEKKRYYFDDTPHAAIPFSEFQKFPKYKKNFEMKFNVVEKH